ncbi:efflux RND transporter periplasmic adaptor subunit [Sphingomonas phyllosphaerae]|uniref:efflux RND transporter periplasmic adaptor subunit n=1 Tax=Sphingomonas phyllosphaerae TaxID=257003 RepID=UPI000408FC8A|nr:HlyD family efflux transporter periplasmic adaptor subunit [Sphingomonas phyllosphaerae]
MTDTPASTPAPEAAAPAPSAKPATRRRAFTILGVIVLVAVIVWAVFHFFFSPPEQETDDAYVAGDVVAITARDPGTVTALHADNTQGVTAGQPLIDLDPTTADVNVAAASAELARAVRSTRADFTRVGQSDAGIVQAQAELNRAQADYARRRSAAAQGAVSGEELDHAADAVKVASANLRLAREQRRQAQATVQGTEVDTNPAVLAAIASYRRAAITRAHMHVLAPIAGVVAQRTVQVGQQVAAGTPLMAIVPLDRLWVDANFRETQLKDVRLGQPVVLTSDMYGDDITYHGRVVGLSAGSGNAFALLPPQNASGNWIKIVQRVPVRIALDARELRANPLRVGLSVKATIDTADTGGPRLAQTAAAPYRGDTTTGSDPKVEATIRRIVAANR